MKTRGLVLDPRRYRGTVMPPLSLEDVSRFGNDGVFVNAPTWVRSPSGLWIIQCVSASSQYINCGTPDSLIRISPRITVLGWAKAPVAAVTQSVASKFDDIPLDRSWDLGSLADADILSGFISDDGTVGGHCKSYYSSIVVWDNTWHQIGMVFDAGTFELVIDGIFDPSPTKTIDVAITTIHHGATATCLGTALHGGVPMWEYNGLFSPVKIFIYALTAAEVYARYQAERSLFGK